VILAAAIGCEGRTSVSGTIVGTDGAPIGNALVELRTINLNSTLENELSSADITEDDGEFSVSITHHPTNSLQFMFRVSKNGYITQSETISAGHFDKNKRIAITEK